MPTVQADERHCRAWDALRQSSRVIMSRDLAEKMISRRKSTRCAMISREAMSFVNHGLKASHDMLWYLLFLDLDSSLVRA